MNRLGRMLDDLRAPGRMPPAIVREGRKAFIANPEGAYVSAPAVPAPRRERRARARAERKSK